MLIIFDFDGVLRFTSWEALFRANIAIAKWAGKDYRDFFRNIEEFKKWWSPDWRENRRKMGIRINKKGSPFHKIYDPYVFIFSWVTDVLEELSKTHTLTILSSASEESIKKSLGSRLKYFKLIVGHEQVKKLKPHPEGINFILKKINIDRSKTLIIGDSYVDVLAGRNAGIKTGVVSWGLDKWKELLKLKPDYLFENPEDLLSI